MLKIDNLLDTLQLPRTPEMRSLVNYFMKQQIPITKESLIASEALLKQTPVAQQQEALASIGKLVNLKLAITSQLFQAMMGVETKASLKFVLNELQAAIKGDKQLPSSQKQQIQSTLQQLN